MDGEGRGGIGGRCGGGRGEGHQQEVPTDNICDLPDLAVRKQISTLYVITFLFSLQVNIERDFNLKELKKAAEEKGKLKEKNAKKDKDKAD